MKVINTEEVQPKCPGHSVWGEHPSSCLDQTLELVLSVPFPCACVVSGATLQRAGLRGCAAPLSCCSAEDPSMVKVGN